jgi:hypothetical protein
MPEFSPAKITIDAGEYDYIKKRIAEADDTKMHREVIAAIMNQVATQLRGMGNTGTPIWHSAQKELQKKGIMITAHIMPDRMQMWKEEEIIIERIKKD